MPRGGIQSVGERMRCCGGVCVCLDVLALACVGGHVRRKKIFQPPRYTYGKVKWTFFRGVWTMWRPFVSVDNRVCIKMQKCPPLSGVSGPPSISLDIFVITYVHLDFFSLSV